MNSKIINKYTLIVGAVLSIAVYLIIVRQDHDGSPPSQLSEIGQKQYGHLVCREHYYANKGHWEGLTLMHFAAKHGNTRLAQFLIFRGAVINMPDDHGETPLQVVVSPFRITKLIVRTKKFRKWSLMD